MTRLTDSVTRLRSFSSAKIETQIATLGQTVFDLASTTYSPGTNSLIIYIDGIRTRVTNDYIETDADTITFNNPLPLGAEVTFVIGEILNISVAAGTSVTYKRPDTGAITRNVEDGLTEMVSVKDFGAVGDGVANDATALNLAFAIPGRMVRLPKGIYLTNSNLTRPACSGIIGEGDNYSIIRAAAGVTKVLPVGFQCKTLKDFRIEGNSTTNAIGLHIGDISGQEGAFHIKNVRVKNFTGTNAVGVKVDFALKSIIEFMTVENNTKNIWIQGNNAFPTTLTFNSLTSASTPGVALEITGGDRLTFNDLVCDSSTAESIIVRPTTGFLATNIVFNRPRFEQALVGSATYESVFDASASSSKVQVTIRDPYYTYSARRSMRFMGTGCVFYLDNPQVPNVANMIVIDTQAVGVCPAWPGTLLSVYNIVTDNVRSSFPLLGLECQDAAFIAYTPIYSSNIGSAAATFTTTPTTTLARWRTVGKTLWLQIQWSATLLAVTPNQINISLPGNLTANGVQAFGPCINMNNGVYEAGSVRGNGANVSQSRLSFGTNYTSGGAVSGFINTVIELA